MKEVVVDTNLILRFLTGDPENQARLAAEIFQQGELGELSLRIPAIVVAEVVFVLTGKVYGISRDKVAIQLDRFLSSPSLRVEERDVLLKALSLFGQHKIDFADAYLAALALSSGNTVVTFDRDFSKIDGLEAQILSGR